MLPINAPPALYAPKHALAGQAVPARRPRGRGGAAGRGGRLLVARRVLHAGEADVAGRVPR